MQRGRGVLANVLDYLTSKIYFHVSNFEDLSNFILLFLFSQVTPRGQPQQHASPRPTAALHCPRTGRTQPVPDAPDVWPHPSHPALHGSPWG